MKRFFAAAVMTVAAAVLGTGNARAQSMAGMDHSQMDMGQAMQSCSDAPATGGIPALSRALGGALRAAPASCAKGYDAELPDSVKKMLASKAMRQHHYLWHLVRDNWSQMDSATKTKLKKQGWEPPRQAGAPGSGIDFLCMHHGMVKEVNQALKDSGDACYKDVNGWNPIPWSPTNSVWPMPKMPAGEEIPDYKKPEETARYKSLVATKYTKDAWLKTRTLDQLGMEFERGIHGWMHMHWSGTGKDQPADPMKCTGSASPCDWLGHPYTAHVNPAFWKLHGWIDDRMNQWAKQHPDQDLDAICSKAFVGPMSMPMGSHGPAAHGMPRGMPGMDGAEDPDSDFNDVVKGLPKSMTKDLHF